MKTFLKLISALFLFFIFIFMGCQKDLSFEGTVNPNKEFTPAFVKSWYNRTFSKTAEFKNYNQKENGKKQPNWKHGTYRKVGNIEILEFPLLKEKKSIAVKSEKGLTSADKKRISSASLKRISFIRVANGEIIIRELDYIPDWEYLKAKNFDISDVQLGKADNKFTGRIVTKKWSGEVLSERLLKDGKIKGTLIKQQKASANNLLQCETWEYCTETEWCEMEWVCNGDQCEYQFVEPENCWWEEECETEEICVFVEDDPDCLGDCESSCNYNISESCECQLYNIGCTGGSGGSGGNNGYNPNDAESILIDTSIANNYPCLDSLLQALPNANREAQRLLHDIFGVNIHSNLLFSIDTSLTSTNTNAYTTPGAGFVQTIGQNSSFFFFDTIMLSPFMITNSSKEFLIGVIMHESIHAYINYRYNQYLNNQISSSTFISEFPIFWSFSVPLDPAEELQHTHMAANYVTRISSIVNAFYNPLAPTAVRNRVSNSIAWEGLRDATPWKIPGPVDTCRVLRDNVAARNTHIVPFNMPAIGSCPAATVRYDSLSLSLPCN
ncbi:MAG: hypothetical protein JNM14_12000 [Ferruginibacter sp.]|nr:hypothetical protein [Ferruginibacter sp.]